MNDKDISHKALMDDLYLHPKFPEAVNLWASFFAKDEDEINYSNWRHLNVKRQEIENKIWKSLISPGAKILEIGCGKGFFLKRLYDNFASSIEYYGIDISSVTIHRNALKYFNCARYLVSTGESLPFKDKSFDFTQIISTMEHVIEPSLVLKEAYRILKPEGYIYIVIHKPSIDPLIIFSLYVMFSKLFKRLKEDPYDKPLSRVREEIFKTVAETELKLIKKGYLVSQVHIPFYRRLKFPMFFLMKIAEITNNLPFSIFKNLEYRLYQK